MKYLLVIMLLVGSGCAMTTHYQREGDNGKRVGYSETKITLNSYRIRYLDVDSRLAYQRFMRRAAELTKENGYEFFKIKDQGGLKDSSSMAFIANTAIDMSLNQFEATVVFEKTKSDDSIEVKEVLDTQKDVIAKETEKLESAKKQINSDMKKMSGSI